MIAARASTRKITYVLPLAQCSQGRETEPHEPYRRILGILHEPWDQAEDVREEEEPLGGFLRGVAIVRRVHVSHIVAESIESNDIACASLEYAVKLNHFLGRARFFKARHHLPHVSLQDGFEAANASDREKGVKSIATATVQVMTWRGHDRVRG